MEMLPYLLKTIPKLRACLRFDRTNEKPPVCGGQEGSDRLFVSDPK
ncbi:hypothetical protein CKA32_003390 [Geitlerinema sp. FC II]|nr:hypothetical protein CKA32_003390 [Geitlerinema sp. FC II]